MVKRRIHRKKHTTRVRTGAHRRAFQKAAGKAAEKIAIKAIQVGGSTAKKGGAYAKKHVTKENIRKAALATKAASQKLFALLKKKKKEPQRVTMTLFRK